jgi:hypothetical protein
MEPDACQQAILMLLAEIGALRGELQAEYQKLEAVERALVISQAYARSLKQQALGSSAVLQPEAYAQDAHDQDDGPDRVRHRSIP